MMPSAFNVCAINFHYNISVLIEILCKATFVIFLLAFIFMRFILVRCGASGAVAAGDRRFTLNETHFYAKCWLPSFSPVFFLFHLLWQRNPLENKTYHRIMNATIKMSENSWNKTRMN